MKIEKVQVSEDRLYGVQTALAVENFPISGEGIGRDMIGALGLVKVVAAKSNLELGLLDPVRAGAIILAATQVEAGDLDEHFPVDVFQTGSGTSSNMNVNEVVASRANQIISRDPGAAEVVHPNDHVNLGQSSNDVFPSAIHVAAVSLVENNLLPALDHLHGGLVAKGREFEGIVKIGRTHLMEATPMTLGQEFSGFAAQISLAVDHLKQTAKGLFELPIGGTAVGTGLNTHPDFGRLVALGIAHRTDLPFVEASNHFEAQASRDAAVRVSGALRALAVGLMKIANDIRWLGSGPDHGLSELKLPTVQPGSSIMPGKTNPVIAEAMVQVCAQVIGNDAAIAVGGMLGNFQLNTMQPLIARNLLEQVRLLSTSVVVFADRLVAGLSANKGRIASSFEKSTATATALAPHLGYDRTAALVKRVLQEGRTVREVALEEGLFTKDELDVLLNTSVQAALKT
jgi:fumarate hydratase, class II